jgi:hypothetical protein
MLARVVRGFSGAEPCTEYGIKEMGFQSGINGRMGLH